MVAIDRYSVSLFHGFMVVLMMMGGELFDIRTSSISPLLTPMGVHALVRPTLRRQMPTSPSLLYHHPYSALSMSLEAPRSKKGKSPSIASSVKSSRVDATPIMIRVRL
ncbi:hypothetical protein EJ04DRAFT_85019 [Polyplosphaeria fusca]|uniref:Uncharacterized protein n=1 Tax=Polyplosphaeria fusca TaxID=682080 RepID=A0A9P4QQ55_9PLEO|nr:hypothetical protein EJ04DRAFT_85019 [Polyplosphaeria fusca]